MQSLDQVSRDCALGGETLRPGPSGRQLECLRLIAEGKTSREIARALGLSPRTVDNYVQNIFARLGVRSRAQAVARAIELQYLPFRADPS